MLTQLRFSVCLRSHRIRRPDSDTLDESLGEAVMNAVEIIPSCHLRLIRTLLQEILSDGDLLTMAAACGINPVTAVAITESQMRPSHKAAWVFLPWFAQSDLIPKAKYLHLKFGFQCASLLAGLQQYSGGLPPRGCVGHSSDSRRTPFHPYLCPQHLREC